MTLEKAKNIAVIFAGGVGTRMGYKSGPKQFMSAKQKPIIIYTLELFEKHEEIDCIYIATVSTYIDYMHKLVEEYNIKKVVKVISGGNTAHQSIYNILSAAFHDGHHHDSIVLIHDGVRPIVSYQMITDSISHVKMTGNSIACTPAIETICKSKDGVLADEMLDRNEMYILQAPQSFKLGYIYELNKKASEENLTGDFVDQASMAKFFGAELNLLPGIVENIKITTKPDYEYFKYLVESGKYSFIINS